MTVWQNELNERKSREEYFALLESDPEHSYEYLIEVFRREKNGFWLLHTLGRDDTVQLHHLGIQFSVAEVYQNTSLIEE